MGVSVSEGTITKWLKQPGETIAQDEPLLEISTDKVDTEVPSPASGVVAEILVAEGTTVEVGTILAVLAPAGAASSSPAAAPAPEPAARRSPRPEPAVPAVAPRPARAYRGKRSSGNGRAFVSPVVARIASEHGVDPAAVPGTGTGGRVTKKDILAFIDAGAPAAASAGGNRSAGDSRSACRPRSCSAPAAPAAARQHPRRLRHRLPRSRSARSKSR